MTYSNKYIGIPFVERGRVLGGVDCWGLVCIVYQAEFGIIINRYDELYDSCKDLKRIHDLLHNEVVSSEWVPISDYKPTDLMVFRTSKFETHVSMYVDRQYMLHTTSARGCSHLVKHTQSGWVNRLVGVYRHKDVIANV